MKVAVTTHNLAVDRKRESEDACAAEVWHDSVIAVVADGVGHAQHGGEAARRTVESIVTNFKSRPKSWSVPRALEEFTRLINRSLYHESLVRCERPELLTTVAAVAIEGDRLYGLNAGDSRVYLWQNGRLRQLSQDDVESDPALKHVLTRAIGMDARITLHAFEATITAGDRVLLCSDGLQLLSDDQLGSQLCNHATARTLVASARETATDQNMDDMSAIVLDIVEPGDSRHLSLEVPGLLRAGQVYDGCELVRPLNPTERTWIGRLDGREIVIKFATEQARDNETVHNQFAREIWSITRFKSDFFIHAFLPRNNRTFCYCMEYVQAPTLREVLKNGPLTVPEVVALGEFLIDAAQFFAAQDLVHGDIKPDNILVVLVNGKKKFKLIDFGSVTEIFSISSRAGTPSYLAPERFREAPISERTEIFSIGVTLYQALSGKYPYGEIEPFQTPVFHGPPRLTKLNTHIPPWLEAVVQRAVAVSPKDRYQNYSEMKFELQNPEKVRPWFRKDTPLIERNPLLFYKIGFFVLLIACLVLLGLLMNRK